MSYTLGVSSYYHDSAATLLKNDEIICAFQEERFTRIKQDKSFPREAILACLKQANIRFSDINLIAYYEDSELKFERICETYKSNFPKGAISFTKQFSHFSKRKNILSLIKDELRSLFPGEIFPEFYVCQHHLSHAASAFYPSPWETAAVLCVDGVGEWATTSAWLGNSNQIENLFEVRFPHSLGLLYSAFTYYCGFKVDSGEYKLMGLAPYGVPRYVDVIKSKLISIQDDGMFKLNRQFFDYEVGECMISEDFEKLFGGPAREPESQVTQKEMDLAASIQVVTEEVMLGLAKKVKSITNSDYLCLAGGVALNCVSNGKLLKSGLFKQIFVQPASGDAGASLGAALQGYYTIFNGKRVSDGINDKMQGGYLGNEYSNEEVKLALDSYNAKYVYLDDEALIEKTAELLKDNKVIGWVQGRMEFGPRALGGRSIIGNSQSEQMQSVMNLKIKNRESFRPFAPAVLVEEARHWFDLEEISPYMLMVAPVHLNKRCESVKDNNVEGIAKLKIRRSIIPAVTHVDFSSRVQTVDGKYNPRFRELIKSFSDKTEFPVIINTSFNVRGEPIVESPKDAYRCFMRTEMDCLIVNNYLVIKTEQPEWHEEIDWRTQYALD